MSSIFSFCQNDDGGRNSEKEQTKRCSARNYTFRLVPYNAAEKASPPKTKKKTPNYFQPEVVAQVMTALKTEPLKWQLATILLISTGCRRGEIMGLKWEKINFEDKIHTADGQRLGCVFYYMNDIIALYKPKKLCYNEIKAGDSMSQMTVYHGGYCPVTTPEIRQGKYTKDFGTGFYCTLIKEQAQRWAKRHPTPTVSIYDVHLNTELKILEFPEMTDQWLDFIVDCRYGVSHDYDVVIGAMANDQIYNYVADFMDGSITREQFWVMAKFKYPTHQICFCSDAALKCLTYRTSEEAML